MPKYSFTTRSPDETVELGKKIGGRLRGGDVIAFQGGLGAGKTTMTRGIAVGMGLKDNVSSPTFALVNEYPGPVSLIHFDMYRISGALDLESTGFFDYLSDDAVIAVEWSENIAKELPEGCIVIEISPAEGDAREITVIGDDRFDL